MARARPYLLPLAVSSLIGAIAASKILGRAGEPALPLDDAFIHLQYARRLAEGHWFSYSPAGGYSSGATSLLWPILLAPFFVLGLDGIAVIWVAWALGILFHAAVAVETTRLAEGIGTRAGALGAGAMSLAFAAFAWFAMSGMETIAFAWLLTRGVRVAADHAAGNERPRELAVWGLLAPLVRPEGALVSALALLAPLLRLRLPIDRRAAWLLAPAAGPLIIPAMHRALSGEASSSTARVKWLVLDPYLDARGFATELLANVHLWLTDLIAGGKWTWLFMVEGFVWLLALGTLTLVGMATRPGRGARSLIVVLALAGSLIPCSYSTMLWNRVRYIWPFAGIWFAVASCFASELGRAAGRRRAAYGLITPTLVWGMAAALLTKVPRSLDDLAQSARAISLQQVALGRWAADNLPDTALIGVNDTGAIAYFSRRGTFDVVGLTTLGEAGYWAEGAGSRFEHYESLAPERLPTHFIVYDNWMAIDAVLGEPLVDATVYEQSILGGDTMTAYRTRYDLLGSGRLPFDPPSGPLLDELDVADLGSERAHAYARLDARARFNVARSGLATHGETVADGGRIERWTERFELSGEGPAILIARAVCEGPLVVWLDGVRLGEMKRIAATADWQEHAIELPETHRAMRIEVRPAEWERFASFHYWLYARR